MRTSVVDAGDFFYKRIGLFSAVQDLEMYVKRNNITNKRMNPNEAESDHNAQQFDDRAADAGTL